MKKRTIGAALAVVIGGVVFGLTTPGLADKPDRGPKPPKAAIDQMRSKLQAPDKLDPDSIGGQGRPGASGAALILRDPLTGDVQREADGKPKLARNPDGSVALLTPEQVPEEQKQAQAKHEERVGKANAGDRAEQAHQDNENRKTADAIKQK